jgi:hypothetical protein
MVNTVYHNHKNMNSEELLSYMYFINNEIM